MIIRPKNTAPIQTARGSLYDLILFPVYQTREDYAQDHDGRQPPEPDPNLREKNWYDPQYQELTEDNGEVAIYRVLARDPKTGEPSYDAQGRPRIGTLVIPQYIAGRVNIPYKVSANEFPQDSAIMRLKPYPVPIRELHEDEELRRPDHPMGDVYVVNRRLEKPAEPDFPRLAESMARIEALLEKIAAKLGI